jgi:hypothetical protein
MEMAFNEWDKYKHGNIHTPLAEVSQKYFATFIRLQRRMGKLLVCGRHCEQCFLPLHGPGTEENFKMDEN